MGPKKHRFAVLDAWRGIAACLVALLHATSWHGFNTHLDHVALIQNSWLMVDFFFVLSGFVISHAAFGNITNGRTATAFIVRRFGRLWPLHAVVLAIFVGLAVAKSIASHGAVPAFAPYHSRLSVFYNLLMIQTIDVSAIYAWNSASWTIGVEFYTYFVFVGLCLLVTRKRFSTIAPSLVLIGLALIALIAGGTMESTSMARCIYGFFAGHLTYLFWCRRKNRSPAAEWLALALAAAIVSFSAIRPLQFFTPLVFAFVVWVFAAETGLLSRFAKTIPMQNLGTWSYSIYMTHMLGIHGLISLRAWLDARHMVWDANGTGDAIVLVYMAAIILLSGVTYRYIENPARNYFNRQAGQSDVHVSRSSAVV
jgi:peptidoglycan/LPS O-acetylase OafA/YrhL